jgi:hypothetical protein
LARDCACDQGLAGAGRADKEHATRDAAAEPLELRRLVHEFGDLLEIP